MAEGQPPTEDQKAALAVMKKQVSLSSLLVQKFTTAPLTDCLTYKLLAKLIKDQHWRCVFLMRIVLLFLKQAQNVAAMNEVIQVGVTLID